MQDPIADMLTRVRNAQCASHKNVEMPASKQKVAIAIVLKEEGYIDSYKVTESDKKPVLSISLKYFEGAPVITRLVRKSRPSIRTYKKSNDLSRVNGFGVAILSTSKGVISDKKARKLGIGGELLCEVA